MMTSVSNINARKRSIRALIIINSSILLISLIYFIFFNLTRGTPSEPVCFVKDNFGFYCPGCGGSRSLDALLRLDLIGSFIYYPPILISTAVILINDILLIISAVKNVIMRSKYYIFIIIPLSIILNFIIRNLLLRFGIDPLGDLIK